MKIKLKSLGLPFRTGTIKQSTKTTGSAKYGGGLPITEMYLRDTSGELKGVQLGVDYQLYIPFVAFGAVVPKKTDRINFDSKDYAILDIMLKRDSDYEDHYKLNVKIYNA